MTIDDVNKEYAIISIGNKVVVMQTNEDGSVKELWPFDEFRRRLIKEFIKVRSGETVKIVPLADFWLKSNRGRSYDRLVYAMPGSQMQAGPRDYNGWLGFSVPAIPGDWSLNRQHILDVICNGNVEHFNWVMNWIAAMLQFPGRHAWTAMVLRSGQGTGKGHFANNMVGGLFGSQQYLHILGANQLTAEFNEHLSGKSYIFADESTWGGDPRAAAKLKGLITEDTVPIHRKFLKMIEEPSALHIIIASNNEWPIPIEHDDRRFTVFDVAEVRKQDDDHFSKLRKELAEGGLSAMLYELLHYKVNQRMLRTPLVTAAKSEITTQSLKQIEHWWLELLESGVIESDEWPDRILKKDLHRNYMEFLDRHHRSSRERKSTETEMGMFLTKYTPLRTKQMTVDGKIERVVYIPSLLECRDCWIKAFHWPADYVWNRYSEMADEERPWESRGAERRDPEF